MLAEDGCTEGEKQHQMRLSNSSETSGEQSPPIHLGETSVQRKSREARAGSSPSAKAWTAGRGATSLLAAAERRASLFTELAAAEERLVASAAAEVEASEAAAATNARASAMVSRAARAARAAGGHARTPLGRAGSGELSPGSRTATFERGAAHRNSGDARSAAPPLASGGGEAAILGDGKWIFGRVLPPDSLESAAWVALELLRAAPSCGSSAEGRASVLLVTHVCLPSLRALETAEPPLVDGTATTSLRPASPNATSSPGSTRVGLAAAAATPATAPDSGTTAEASPRPAQGVAGAPASFGQALLSARASDGATLLIAAAAAGATPLVQALLNGERRRGEQVDPYAKTDGGSTALHAAAMGSHRETCALLLASTGLPLGGQTAADSLGRTPLDVCPPRFREELVELRSETDASVDKRGVLLHRPLLSSAAQLLAGRYHVHTRIGQKVVLAEDVVRHRPVALKFAQTRERLEAEASVLGIVGPEVAPEVFDSLYDEAGEGGQQHVLVMQAADPNYYTPSSCSELAHFCSRPREGIEVRTHAQRLLQCVLALHDRGLVHADLKVQHFLRFSGEWKLVDFDNVLSEGTECVPSCTVRYAAPEVAASRLEATPMRVTAAVDVWAMALILYELFAGRPLVDDLTLVDLARVPETAVVAKLAEDSLLHTAQKRLLLDMLQVEPEARGRTLRVPPSPSAAASHVGAVPPPLALGPSTTPPCCSAASFSHVGGASSPSTSRAALREVLGRAFFTTGEDTEEARQLEVLALFSSPRKFRTGERIPPLQLMREVTSLQDGIPRRLREIRPAARFPEDIAEVVQQISPRVIMFSGHGDAVRKGLFAGALAFEVADGTIQLPDPAAFIGLLGHATMPRLECVFLNGCKTLHPLGERIVSALPHLAVVGWYSAAEDQAAVAFSRGFFDALGRGGGGGGKSPEVPAGYEAYLELLNQSTTTPGTTPGTR